MATTKFKMPTDKQIWAEVDAFLATYPEPLKKIKKPPSREELFDTKKAAYKATPARLKALALAEQEKAKAIKEADEAYLALRKKQGKPIVTLKELVKKYPKITFDKTYTQQKLHEKAEILAQLEEVKKVSEQVERLEAVSRKLTMKYLSMAYGAYRSITKSEVAEETFASIRSSLWHVFNIKTHADIPRPSLLLKMVFKETLEKTIHLYARSFMLADGYDVEQADFEAFIKDLGGLEKIRKAYATVIAADAGKLKPEYVKDAEYIATKTALHDLDAISIIQLQRNQCVGFKNDLLGYYSLMLTHLDPMGQLEIYTPIPSTKAIEKHVLDFIADIASNESSRISAKWHADKHQAEGRVLKMTNELLIEKEQKKQAKAALKQKKEAALAKKNAAVAKRFEKQRKSKGA